MTKIRETWTYRHIQTIIIVGLCTGVTLAHYGVHLPESKVVTYIAEASTVCEDSLTCAIEERAQKIYLDSIPFHKEQARIDAIGQINEEMLVMLETSPHIDYVALEEKYGYK